MIEIRVVDGAVEYRTKTGIDWQNNVVLVGDWSEWRKAAYYGRAFTPQQEHRLDNRIAGVLPTENPVITDGLLRQLGEARTLVRAQAERNAKLAADNERQAKELHGMLCANAAQAGELRRIALNENRMRELLKRVRAQVAAAGGKTAELLDEIDAALKD